MGQSPARKPEAFAGGEDPDGVWALHLRYHQTRDPEARECLVAHYLGFARSLAVRMYRHGEPLDDLIQVAYEHLVKALDRFDPERGTPFEGFASPTITGAMKRHYRDLGWSVRVPRPVHELAPQLQAATATLSQRLGRTPTDAELADELAVPVEQLRRVQVAVSARQVKSLDAPAVGTTTPISERRGHNDAAFERTEAHLDLTTALHELPDQDVEVLREYYVDELSQDTIAGHLGVSQMQVSRRLSQITARLRSSMLST